LIAQKIGINHFILKTGAAQIVAKPVSVQSSCQVFTKTTVWAAPLKTH